MRLCPKLILVPPNFELYKRESKAVRAILNQFTDRIEPLSLDEAYLDVSDASSATVIAQEIRDRIRSELGLTASAGIAPNKFLAKIASDWKKPDGQFVIRPKDIEVFMPALKIEKIHGVGKVTAKKMHGFGLHTCGDIQKQSLLQLQRWFGSRAGDLRDSAFGIDHRPVETSGERKSLTVEETFATDISKLGEALARLPDLYHDWEKRMERSNERDRIRGFVVKLKFHDFKTTTHEMSSRHWPTLQDFERLVSHAWERRGAAIRLLGIGVRLAGDPTPEETSQLQFEL